MPVHYNTNRRRRASVQGKCNILSGWAGGEGAEGGDVRALQRSQGPPKGRQVREEVARLCRRQEADQTLCVVATGREARGQTALALLQSSKRERKSRVAMQPSGVHVARGIGEQVDPCCTPLHWFLAL